MATTNHYPQNRGSTDISGVRLSSPSTNIHPPPPPHDRYYNNEDQQQQVEKENVDHNNKGTCPQHDDALQITDFLCNLQQQH